MIVLTERTGALVRQGVEVETFASKGVELRHLRALVALADELHFGRAAMRLHLAQSTLSRTIADLEALLGVPLVDRELRQVELTPGARALLSAAERALAEVQDGIEAARGAPLTLGMMTPYGYRWASALREDFAEDRLRIRSVAPEEGFDVLARDVSVAICAMPIVPPTGLSTRLLTRDEWWAALPRTHPLAAMDRVPFARLGREPLLLQAGHRDWRGNLELIFRAHGLPLRCAAELGSMHELLARVAAGAGWAVASSREAFHHWDGVVLRPLSGLDGVDIAAIWSPGRATPATASIVKALVLLSDDQAPPRRLAA